MLPLFPPSPFLPSITARSGSQRSAGTAFQHVLAQFNPWMWWLELLICRYVYVSFYFKRSKSWNISYQQIWNLLLLFYSNMWLQLLFSERDQSLDLIFCFVEEAVANLQFIAYVEVNDTKWQGLSMHIDSHYITIDNKRLKALNPVLTEVTWSMFLEKYEAKRIDLSQGQIEQWSGSMPRTSARALTELTTFFAFCWCLHKGILLSKGPLWHHWHLG
jgi:hypothetical protein